MGLEKELVLVEGHLKERGDELAVHRRRHAYGEDGKIEFPLEGLAEEGIFPPYQEARFGRADLRDVTPGEEYPFLLGILEEFLAALGMGPYVHVEVFHIGVLVLVLYRIAHAEAH